jgi:putative transposase
VIEQDESHTSKCSFLDNESIEHHDKYMGKRVKRGIFRSARGILINADVQGALNVIRKAVPKAFSQGETDRIEGVGLHPKRANIKKILSFVGGS